MRKVFMSRFVGLLGIGATTTYTSPTSGIAWNAGLLSQPWLVEGTFRNLAITLSAAPGSGVTRTFDLLVNGAATSISIAISGTGTTGTSGALTAAVAASDTIALRCTVTGGSPASAIARVSIEFDSASPRQSGHSGVNCSASLSASNTAFYFNPLTYVRTGADPASLLASSEGIIATTGTLTGWRVDIDAAPGSGKSRTFVLYKNGVAQDGTGGTPDTTITLSGTSAVSGTVAFSIAVVPGDEIWAKGTGSGTPAACTQSACAMSFTAAVDGYSMMACSNTENASSSSNEFMSFPGERAWDVTEANALTFAGTTSIQISNLYTKFSSSGQRATTLRHNTADSALVATTTGTNALRVQDAVHTVTLESGDTWDLKSTDIGGGFKRTVFGLQMYVEPPPSALRVTQMLRQVFTNEDADADIPPQASACTGGGTVPTGTNPTPGTSLANAVDPEFWLEIDVRGRRPFTMRLTKGGKT